MGVKPEPDAERMKLSFWRPRHMSRPLCVRGARIEHRAHDAEKRVRCCVGSPELSPWQWVRVPDAAHHDSILDKIPFGSKMISS